jgi:hypothetical protein
VNVEIPAGDNNAVVRLLSVRHSRMGKTSTVYASCAMLHSPQAATFIVVSLYDSYIVCRFFLTKYSYLGQRPPLEKNVLEAI